MAVTIRINDVSLCHKGSGGFAAATVPDVCKTPPQPLPIPYPNTAFAKDLAKGTVTVLVDGGNMAGILGSEFSVSTGDEPGTAGGVKSGVNMKEATWISYSFDVFLEGQNATRLTDKMWMNHGNTVCLGGYQQALPPGGPDPKCVKIAEMIEILINTVRPPTPPGGYPQGYQGLATRWREFAENKGNWGMKPDGTLGAKAKTHLGEYEKGKTRLKEQLKKWDEKDCDNKGPPLPAKAREYADQAPELGPNKPLEPVTAPISPAPTSPAISGEAIAKGAAVTSGIVVTIIIITRIIRLIPPLWPLQLSPI